MRTTIVDRIRKIAQSQRGNTNPMGVASGSLEIILAVSRRLSFVSADDLIKQAGVAWQGVEPVTQSSRVGQVY
ncbi:hypothetical protein ACKWRH_08315 [Bradyrhizobium sp. Pa8]|uniref:hypothetical protein n=1 Tax=Bradyrhizobium sp. Pa8 TaxID=3386552 RepID=UPI00403FBCE0